MKLYSYFRSSAAYRVRIALNLKNLAYETIAVHLVKDGGHNRRPEFRAVNPQMRIPTFVAPSGEVLIQSLAIIEYLDETHPDPPLLPKDPIGRAQVRALADVIACDIHPLNNVGLVVENETALRSSLHNIETVTSALAQNSQRFDKVMVGVENLTGSGNSRGEIAQAADAIRKLGENLDKRTDEISAGLTRFSNSGLKEFEAFAIDGRRTLVGLNKAIKNIAQHPTRLIFGR